MPERITFLGLPNFVGEQYCSIRAQAISGLEPAGLEASWLGTEEPSEIARLASTDPRRTMWIASFNGIPSDIFGLALANHNIYDGGDVRFLGYTGNTDPSEPPMHRLAPDAILEAGNLTGTLANVTDDISGSGSTGLVPTATADPWSVRFSFGIFAAPIDPLPSGMAFVIKVKRLLSVPAAADAPSTYPKLTVELRESDSAIRTLGTRAITEDGGQVLVFPFSRSELSNSTGSGLEMSIAGSTGDSSTGYQYISLEAVAVYYNVSPSGHDYDSGWITVPGPGRPSHVEPTKSLHYFPVTPWEEVTSLAVLLRSDQCRKNPPEGVLGIIPAGVVNKPDLFLQAGILCAGGGITLDRGMRPNTPLARPIASGGNDQTLAGQSYGVDIFRQRETGPVDLMVRRDELEFLLDELAWRRGNHGAFYVAMEPGVELERQRFTAFWATLDNMGVPSRVGRYRKDGQMLFGMTLQLKEKL